MKPTELTDGYLEHLRNFDLIFPVVSSFHSQVTPTIQCLLDITTFAICF